MSSLILGVLAGVATTAVATYLFGPAKNAEFNERYRSRLDWALAEGDKAGAEREAELRRKFEEAKQPRPRLPKNDQTIP